MPQLRAPAARPSPAPWPPAGVVPQHQDPGKRHVGPFCDTLYLCLVVSRQLLRHDTMAIARRSLLPSLRLLSRQIAGGERAFAAQAAPAPGTPFLCGEVSGLGWRVLLLGVRFVRLCPQSATGSRASSQVVGSPDVPAGGACAAAPEAEGEGIITAKGIKLRGAPMYLDMQARSSSSGSASGGGVCGARGRSLPLPCGGQLMQRLVARALTSDR